MSAPWMSREPFVLLEDEPAEDADTAEGQHHHRRHCSRREQLSAILEYKGAEFKGLETMGQAAAATRIQALVRGRLQRKA